jgi:hypothetical protein
MTNLGKKNVFKEFFFTLIQTRVKKNPLTFLPGSGYEISLLWILPKVLIEILVPKFLKIYYDLTLVMILRTPHRS